MLAQCELTLTISSQFVHHFSSSPPHKQTVTVTINWLVKLSAFNAHICPSKYLDSFWK